MPAAATDRKVILLVDPFHALGRAICRELCLRRFRVVAVSAEPVEGEAFGIRMALQGFSVPHRTLPREDASAEGRLAVDLERVYGGLSGVLSFFPLSRRREHWLDLPINAANELVRGSLNRRLRLLRALSPLLARRGFLQNVVMGVVDRGGEPRADADGAVAHLWDDLLAGEWERRGILVRRTYTRLISAADGDRVALAGEYRRVITDFDRCIERTRAIAA